MIKSWIGVCVSVAVLGSIGSAQVTSRVSVGAGGAQANSESDQASVSADGRFVAFRSPASNLVAGDTNGTYDVFVRDLQSGVTERVSIATGGAQSNNLSDEPFISADGRYVVFHSIATNLVAGDTNNVDDIFVRDRQLATTTRASLGAGGIQAGDQCYGGSISADGRYVAFFSFATNLAPPGGAFFGDIYVRDRVGGTTELISVDSGGGQADNGGEYAMISADGNFVAFTSNSTDLVAGDTNGAGDIFVRDRVGATTERVSIDSGGSQANGVSGVFPSISPDGRFVAFVSSATNLVPGDTNGIPDVFLRDRLGSTTERINLDSGGSQATGTTSNAEPLGLSADGRYVAFVSSATNLVPGDTNAKDDIFLRDRLTGTTERTSIDTAGTQANNFSEHPAISGDGRFVAFRSLATNLVPGDSNAQYDIFLRERGPGTDPESAGLGGVPSDGPSSAVSISADDRYVAFESVATNLVVGDTNGLKDVFVRDRQTATTSRVSVGAGGAQGNGDSAHPQISSDGRYVAFESVATNLIAGDTNGASDAFVHDRQTGTTARVSVGSGGVQGNGGSTNPAISGDGAVVAFESTATNLVAGDTNGVMDVFARDGLTSFVSTTARVSVDSGGVEGNAASADPSISSNGVLVAFESDASNLVAGDSNATMDVFVRDRVGNATSRVSVDSGGTQGAGASTDPSISGDGRFVAFASDASNLVGGDSNLTVDVFVRDRPGNATTRVSIDSGGTQGAMASGDPSISADGRFVAFESDASNLVGGDTNATMDVFVHDRLFATMGRVSVDSGGTQGAGASSDPSISADGRLVAFSSDAPNLTVGDTNGFTDAFVRDHGVASAFETYCFGDGTGAPCPCANSGAPGHGCENSATTGGALLTVTGEASFAFDTVQFTSSGEKPTALSIFLQGTQTIAPTVYGDGLRCVGGALKRLYAKSAVAGVVVGPVSGDLSVSARSAFMNQPIPLGSTRYYMVYYRDVTPTTFCPTPLGSNFNGTNGMAIAWGG